MQLFSFLKIKFQDGAHLKRGLFWTYFSHFFYSPGKSYTNSFSTYLTHIHTCILLTLLTLCLTNFEKKKQTNLLGIILFGMSPGVDSYSRVLEQSINNKMVSKII